MNKAIPTQYAITPTQILPSGITWLTPPAITSPTPAIVNNVPKAAKICGKIAVGPT